mgnify:CR=1 FL=1
MLSPTDREFFAIVAETAFCNPFSERRPQLDAQIVGHAVAPYSEAHLAELTQIVSHRIAKLEAEGGADVRRFAAAERELMQTVFLFEIYHQLYEEFDQLIVAQAQAGATSLPVKFANAALNRMRARGIGTEEAARFFSIFYQLRRAFHFIVRGLIGQSASMQEFRRRLWNNVFTQNVQWYERHFWNRMEDFSTLLLGATGTGKGAAAAAIGRSGYIPFDVKQGRFRESFMQSLTALNLSQFPETLIESELFGHRKGAFTGAMEAHQGVFARCSPHGAIFLDEIGEVGGPLQIKLLQVLQERTFRPVGSHESMRFQGRVIAATNRDIKRLRERGSFRDDFYYRLSSDVIHVPTLHRRLQEAPDELRQLLQHTVTRLVGGKAEDMSAMIEVTLQKSPGPDYSWPGNVRELEQAVRQILLTGSYTGSTTPKSKDLVERLITGIETEALDADALLAGYCAILYESTGNYEAVARQTNLDRRTAKKYVQQGLAAKPSAMLDQL